jgi:hypothetical protein
MAPASLAFSLRSAARIAALGATIAGGACASTPTSTAGSGGSGTATTSASSTLASSTGSGGSGTTGTGGTTGGAGGGTSCAGGSDAGTPPLLVSIPNAGQMVLDGDSLVLTSNGALVRVELGSWTVTTLAGDASLTISQALAADAKNFYFFAEDDQNPIALFSCPRAGGAVTKIADAPSAVQWATWGVIAVDASRVYWVDVLGGDVMAAPLNGGPATVIAQGTDLSGGIAVDATSVYWTTSPNVPPGQQGVGGVYAMPLAGGPPALLPATVSQPSQVVSDGTSLYVLDSGLAVFECGTFHGQLVKIPLAGGAATVLASDLDNVVGFAIGNGNAYVTSDDNCDTATPVGTFMKVPLAGGPSTTLATDGWYTLSIVVDDPAAPGCATVYFVTRDEQLDSGIAKVIE